MTRPLIGWVVAAGGDTRAAVGGVRRGGLAAWPSSARGIHSVWARAPDHQCERGRANPAGPLASNSK